MGQVLAGWPRPPEPVQAGRRVALLGVPVEAGASRCGAALGPAALREAGLLSVLESAGCEVDDHGDLSIDLSTNGSVTVGAPLPPNSNRYNEI